MIIFNILYITWTVFLLYPPLKYWILKIPMMMALNNIALLVQSLFAVRKAMPYLEIAGVSLTTSTLKTYHLLYQQQPFLHYFNDRSSPFNWSSRRDEWLIYLRITTVLNFARPSITESAILSIVTMRHKVSYGVVIINW